MSTYLPNSKQKQAIEYHQGPLLIIAGAGTGKTFTLVEKIKYLIEKKLAKPEEIVALTFTEKAAREMEERVDIALPYGCFQTWISTFHSFADQILRQEIHHIGLSSGYRLLSQAESILFLRKNLYLLPLHYYRPLNNPDKFIEGLLQHFSRLRDEDITPLDYLIWVKVQKKKKTLNPEDLNKYQELANAYKIFQTLKTKEGYCDFADLIMLLLQLFRSRKNLLHIYQQKFKYLLIDEFQDTNIAQYQLIKLLCPPSKKSRITVVGDDSQAIYKFRGASVSNLLAFIKDYPKAKQVSLITNYRSHQSILDSAYRLVRHNNPDTLETQLGISKELFSYPKTKRGIQPPEFKLFQNDTDEAEAVAQTIKKLSKNNNFSDFSILVRANNHSEPFQRSLSHYGIPYQFHGPGALFKQPAIKDLIAYLQTLVDLENTPSFYRVLTMSIINTNPQDTARLVSFARKTNLSLYNACEIYLNLLEPVFDENYKIYQPYIPLLSGQTKKQLLKIVTLIKEHLKQLRNLPASQIIYDFLDKTGTIKTLSQKDTKLAETTVSNLAKFFTKIKALENQQKEPSIFQTVEYLNLSLEIGESPQAASDDFSDKNAVHILTIHSAKGLEFPTVFLVNLSQGRFPTYDRHETIPIPDELIKEILPTGNPHILEERRLFYVAITRAKNRLFLSSSLIYGDGKRSRKISQFVEETFGNNYVPQMTKLAQGKKVLYDFAINKPLISLSLPHTSKQQRLSFSHLDTYQTCPLRYFYRYQLNLPNQTNSSASFGQTIHNTLQNFYKEYLNNRSVKFKKLLEIYRDNWIPIGFNSQAHQNRVKSEGKKILESYFHKFHPPKNKIIGLEQFFKLKINQQLYVSGKIDRIDTDTKGNLEIIDYKTGKQPSPKDLEKDLQLSVYALAVTDKQFLNKKLSQVTFSYVYLQNNEKISIKKTNTDVVLIKNTLIKTAGEINQQQYPAQPGRHCDFCPFKIVCDAWK